MDIELQYTDGRSVKMKKATVRDLWRTRCGKLVHSVECVIKPEPALMLPGLSDGIGLNAEVYKP
jgi:hypothetical protein